jgi:hypothetical protein
MPRHPPCAHNNLTTKMLASTLQFSNTTPRGVLPQDPTVRIMNIHPPTPTNPIPHAPKDAVLEAAGKPADKHQPVAPQFLEHPNRNTNGPSIWLLHHRPQPAAVEEVLLRKEVIQPHLPVRLPCYDFVPIASPTFDHSLPYGLGRGLRVLPTFMT